MFERYTEKARRVIFFSRYEAAQFGSPYIESEHVLLGIVRECRDATRLFGDNLPLYSELRQNVQSRCGAQESSAVSVDLPLSNQCKRALAYAAEEAERMRDRHIGAEHLFLGLLRERNCLAAQMLNECGISLEQARAKITADSTGEHVATTTTGVDEVVQIHGAPYPAGYFRGLVNRFVRFARQKQGWKPRDILVEKQTGRVMFYAGQGFDPVKFEVRQGGWKRDHCAVCNWPLYESDDPEHGVAYTNGRDWVCRECHDKFFVPPITPLDDLHT